MSGFVGVLVSDPWLQSQFTQVELRGLKSNYLSAKGDSGHVTIGNLPPVMVKLKGLHEVLTEEEISAILNASYPDDDHEMDFEAYLRVLLIVCCSAHINGYLGDDPFLKNYLPLDPASDDLFNLAKDGVLLCKLINVAVPGTIDERAINTKRVLNPWERNENHTLCLNSAKAIGCTVVNIGTQDLVEGRPHLVLGFDISNIKIQLLADLKPEETPQLVD
ncbi:hypothetical protein C4D60_Mb07t11600 [Musa balbisiana]|uniref:Calponin-homology (CH) domain-containing protein n=1 Tax=Musa balbisiana TaxID=52838 RepID=A0A4S8JEM8_MUSBA|nr:hypothetical protein C4D60_Mb07t11600 [Musa balbisiana]